MTATLAAPIEFTVPGLPVAQPRQRHRIIATGGRTFAQNYTPTGAPVNVWKAAIQQAAAAQYSGAPLEGALVLEAVFVFPRPKYMNKRGAFSGRLWKDTKPDIENVLKALMDALSGLTFVDDAQIARVVVEKWIARADEPPETFVRIKPAVIHHAGD